MHPRGRMHKDRTEKKSTTEIELRKKGKDAPHQHHLFLLVSQKQAEFF